MKMSDGLFLQSCRAVAGEFPDIQYREIIADNCTMQLVLNPWQFDVLLMGNMMGDIISDLCAGLIGGPGTVPGISVGPDVRVFEAIHGDAPHLEGRDLANPLTLLVPAVAMLRHLGEQDAADRILAGLEAVLREARTLTSDLGGTAGTTEMCDAIIDNLPPAARE
jgi:isocitrate dehydrogenase (NAD+)